MEGAHLAGVVRAAEAEVEERGQMDLLVRLGEGEEDVARPGDEQRPVLRDARRRRVEAELGLVEAARACLVAHGPCDVRHQASARDS